jgi:alpha-L-fucosidase
MIRRVGLFFIMVGLLMPASGICTAQEHKKYEPTLASLDTHPLPQWYANAKLGIFIHWGLYSVPGWAPISHPEHNFTNLDYIKNNPYAEWYLNTMRIPGSPTWNYHREHYGANFSYYDFAPIFNRESKKSGQRSSATRERAMWC